MSDVLIRSDLEAELKRLVNEAARLRFERDEARDEADRLRGEMVRFRAIADAMVRAWPESVVGGVRREGGHWECYPASSVVSYFHTKAEAVCHLAGIETEDRGQ